MQFRTAALFLLIFLFVATMTGTVRAHSPSPEARAQFIAEGVWEEKVAQLRAFEASQPPDMYEKSLALHLGKYRAATALSPEAVDTIRVVVILVEFPDFKHDDDFYAIPGGGTQNCYYSATTGDFDSLLFSVRGEDAVYNPTGSWTDYYMETSYGTYFIQGDVFGWFEAPNNYSYYVGDNDGLGGGGSILAHDACAAADAAGVDFSPYAPDGYIVPGVVIVHAGPGAEQAGTYGIWSHRSSMSPGFQTDGVSLGGYTMQPEERVQGGLVNMGVFAHEWGHVMGIRDFYDITYRSEGLGNWCLMAGGSWNDGGRRPAHMNCFIKDLVKFNQIVYLEDNILDVEIPPASTSPIAYCLRDNPVVGGGITDAWFVENRQPIGFDAALPGDGLLIYHFDGMAPQHTPSEWPPDEMSRLQFSIEEADGNFDLLKNLNSGQASDCWPLGYGDGAKRNFHDYTSPNSRTGEDSLPSQVSVLNISDSDSIMTADLGVVWALPWPELTGDSVTFSDVNGGNGNGIIEQGETIEAYVEVINLMRRTFSPFLRLEISNPDIQITSNDQTMGIALSRIESTHNFDPIIFTVPEDAVSSIETFKFTIFSDSIYGAFSYPFANEMTFEIPIGKSQIMVVDDDDGATEDRWFTGALERLRYPYEVWNKFTQGSPTPADLEGYPFVFWMTGSYNPPRTTGSELTTTDIETMKAHMDGGGHMMVASIKLGLTLADIDSTFMANYLHANLAGSVRNKYYLGVDDNPVGDGLFFFGRIGGVDWIGNGTTALLDPINGGQAAFTMTNQPGTELGGAVCGVTFDGSYRSIFLPFGAEMLMDVENDLYGYDVSDSLIARAVQFFARGSATPVEQDDPGENLLPADFALEQNYPNPFNPSTEISYTLAGPADKVNLSIFNVLGRRVATLVDRVQGPGKYTISWNGQTDGGGEAASGVYFYRLTHGESVGTKKMVLIK